MKKEFVEISSGRRCVFRGPRNGFPELYCIHGGMGLSSDSLFDGLKNISSMFDLIFIDLRGTGESDPANSYSLDDFSDDVVEIATQIGSHEIKGIFGHSLGGMVAINLLGRKSNFFKFSILSNTAMDDQWRTSSKESIQKRNDQNIAKAVEKFNQSPDDVSSLRNLAISYGPLYFPELPESLGKEQMEKFSYKVSTIEYTGSKVYPQMDLKNLVSKINVPTLVIGSSMDEIVPEVFQLGLHKKLKNSHFESIPGAGHFPFITKNKIFTNIISLWWKENQGGTV